MTNISKSLDALLVLGGEGDDQDRSQLAYQIYLRYPVNVVLTGAHGGLDRSIPEKPESEQMKEVLLYLGVPEEVLHLESESMDTLANIVYAQPILEELGARNVGLITERDHMKRSLWLAREVLGDDYTILPLPTKKRMSLVNRCWEFTILQILEFELHFVPSGNQKAFEHYLQEKHPFHGNGHIGAYNVGARLMKFLQFSYE